MYTADQEASSFRFNKIIPTSKFCAMSAIRQYISLAEAAQYLLSHEESFKQVVIWWGNYSAAILITGSLWNGFKCNGNWNNISLYMKLQQPKRSSGQLIEQLTEYQTAAVRFSLTIAHSQLVPSACWSLTKAHCQIARFLCHSSCPSNGVIQV